MVNDVRNDALPGRRVLAASAGAAAVTAIAALVGGAISARQIGGAPAWEKPLKFAISIALYCATVGYLLAHVPGHRRSVRAIAWCTAVALLGELTLIVVQAARGRASHFNTATPVDAAIYAAMGALVAVVFGAAIAADVVVWRCGSIPQPLAAAARAGLLVAVLGMAQAALMVVHGAHTVGAADGGPGLPLTGWSTTHGDLRVAHFVGLHALQFLLGYAWLLARIMPTTPPAQLAAMVEIAAVACAGLVVLLTWQAERGEPLLHPGTVVAVIGVAWLCAAAVATVLAARAGVLPLVRV